MSLYASRATCDAVVWRLAMANAWEEASPDVASEVSLESVASCLTVGRRERA